MIKVLDYGLGNIKSVCRALEKAGAEVSTVNSPEDIRESEGIVVPGVGAFRLAMDNLKNMRMTSALMRYLEEGRPYLGICLGMQILFTRSLEHGVNPGLGFIKGDVVRFGTDVKIPHMGWNQVGFDEGSEMFENISSGAYFYFDHSYYTVPSQQDAAEGYTGYGIDFVSAVKVGNVWGVQFHPEKSSGIGIALLRNFIDAC